MGSIRVAFESSPNYILPRQIVDDVRVNQVLRHFWASRVAHWGDGTAQQPTCTLGNMVNQHGVRTMQLLDQPSSGDVVSASNKKVNYIILPLRPSTEGCQTFNTFKDGTSEYMTCPGSYRCQYLSDSIC